MFNSPPLSPLVYRCPSSHNASAWPRPAANCSIQFWYRKITIQYWQQEIAFGTDNIIFLEGEPTRPAKTHIQIKQSCEIIISTLKNSNACAGAAVLPRR